MTELLAEILALTVTVSVLLLFALIGFVMLMAAWMAIRGVIQRRPHCYKKHDFKPHNSVLFNCGACAYEKECWK